MGSNPISGLTKLLLPGGLSWVMTAGGRVCFYVGFGLIVEVKDG